MRNLKFKNLLAVYVLLIIGGLIMVLPFYWMIISSLKSSTEVTAIPPTFWPSDFIWENYILAFEAAPFARYFINSVVVALITTVGELITSILAAFAFSKMEFWGKNVLFIFLISTMMVPHELLTISNFITIANWNLMDTYWALILPWLASVFSVFILKQSFESVPDQLYYAAKSDGCSDWRYIWEILVPVSKSSITSVMILKVIGSWNSFMWPLMVTNTAELRTMPVGLQAFTTEAGSRFELLMAGATIVVVPIVIIYILLQRNIVKGVANTGIKG